MSQNSHPSPVLDKPLATALAGAAGRRAGFYERAVLGSLSKMMRGCLQLELPDGSHRLIGTPGSDLTARIRIVRDLFFKRCVL